MKTTASRLIWFIAIIVAVVFSKILWDTFKPPGPKLTEVMKAASEHARAGEVQITYPDGRKEWVKTPNSQRVAEMIEAEGKKIREMEEQYKRQLPKK